MQCVVPRMNKGASKFFFSSRRRHTRSVSAFLLNRSSDLGHVFCKLFNWRRLRTRRPKLGSTLPVGSVRIKCTARSEERFSRNAETDLVCRLLLEKKKLLHVNDHSPRLDPPAQHVSLPRRQATALLD